jgi:catechol 2,3-dioxygenase-like lactoylglutathione lyase family enzyme
MPMQRPGTNDTYIALGQAKAGSNRDWMPYSGEPGVNHLAYAVDDVESLRARLKAAGFRESTVPNAHPPEACLLLRSRRGLVSGISFFMRRPPNEAYQRRTEEERHVTAQTAP